jgi:mono/diheme cytochrome c family protein
VLKASSKRSVFLAAAALAGGLAAGSLLMAAGANAQEVAKVDREAARDLFHGYSCSACHALADANAGGSVGPTLDNPSLTRATVIDRITNGQGAMPAFAGQLSDEEVALLADYIVEASHDSAGH